MIDRNLQYLSLVEVLYGYPIDGVVLTTGCDKTTPAQIMAAATVDIPAIVLSGGPMLNGWFTASARARGRSCGRRASCSRAARSTRGSSPSCRVVGASAGHCNTMGTATTMNSLAEALGMSLPGCAAIPLPTATPGDGVSDRQAHRRHGARGPEAVGGDDPRGVRERDRRLLRDRRLDERADPGERDRATHRRGARQRRLGAHRVRHPAARQPAARRRVPRRGVLPRGRRARRRRRADRDGQDRQDARHDERQDALREQRGTVHDRPRGDQGTRRR